MICSKKEGDSFPIAVDGRKGWVFKMGRQRRAPYLGSERGGKSGCTYTQGNNRHTKAGGFR